MVKRIHPVEESVQSMADKSQGGGQRRGGNPVSRPSAASGAGGRRRTGIAFRPDDKPARERASSPSPTTSPGEQTPSRVPERDRDAQGTSADGSSKDDHVVKINNDDLQTPSNTGGHDSAKKHSMRMDVNDDRVSILQGRQGSVVSKQTSEHKHASASSKLRQLTRQRIYQDTARVRNRALDELEDLHNTAITDEEREAIRDFIQSEEGDEDKNWGEELRNRIKIHLGFWKLLLYDAQIWWLKRKRNSLKKPEHRLFLSQIRKIEGRFGSGVVSFFVFLRWMIEMNIMLMVIWLTLVIIPNAAFFDRSKLLFSNHTTDNLYLRNLLDGGLYFKYTTLFYGAYFPDAQGYPIALMYLICIVITYFGGFFLVLRSIAQALQAEGDAKSGKQHPFTSLIFTSWDFSLKSRSGSENLSKGIGQSIRDFIIELEARRKMESMSGKQKVTLIFRRIFAWCLSFFLLVTGSATIFILISRDLVAEFRALGLDVTIDSTIVVYTPSVIFVVINVFVPQILFWLPELEQYHHGKVQLYVSITRVFILRMVNLIALLVSLHLKIEQDRFEGCAGTLIGQELYRLIVLDTLIQMFVLTVPRYMLFYWTRDPDEFKMPPLVLKLLYRQALVWTCTVVSPLTPMLGVFSMVILFCTVFMMVNKTCKPPTKRWNQPRNSSFFMSITAATLAVIIGIVSMLVTRNDIIRIGQVGGFETKSCGPFGNETMLDIYISWRDNMEHTSPNTHKFLNILTSPSVIGPLIFILFAVIYFQTVQITFEKKRKLEMYNDLVAGQQMERNLIRRLGWDLMSKNT